jgi:hypothetical protein
VICSLLRICVFLSDSAEIRLKNYGADAVEVIDNGSGVEECNFEALSEFLFCLHF